MRVIALIGVIGALTTSTAPGPAAAQIGGSPQTGLVTAPPAPDLGRAAVRILAVSGDGGEVRSVSGFVLDGGYVVTALHCLEETGRAYVNFGEHGAAAVTGVVQSDPDNDVVVLKVEVPRGVLGLRPRATRPPGGAALTILIRSKHGSLMARSGEMVSPAPRDDMLSLETTVPAGLGDSGSAVVDEEGLLAGVVTRLCGRGGVAAGLTPSFRLRPAGEARPLGAWLEDRRRSLAPEVHAHWLDGEARRRAGRFAEALGHYRLGLEIDPANFACIQGSVASVNGGREGRAGVPAMTGWLEAHTRAHPGAREAWVLLANLRYRAGQYAAAVEAYDRALELRDTPATRCFRAGARAALGDAAGSVRDARAILDADPAFEPAITAWLSALGEAEAGVRVSLARRLVDLCPDDAEAVFRLADVLADEGRLGELGPYREKLRARRPFVANELDIRLALRAGGERPAPAGGNPDDEEGGARRPEPAPLPRPAPSPQ